MLVAPSLIARRPSPVIEVVLVAAGPDHSVDAGAAAEGLARGLGDRAVVDAWAALCSEVPVEIGALVEEPGFGDQDARLEILAARLQQQHLCIAVLGEAPRHDRAGGTGTDDDIIVAGLESRTERGLIGLDRDEFVGSPGNGCGRQTEARGARHEGRAVDFPSK